jgi:hypothetical protein
MRRLLRTPAGPAEVVADGIRVLALVSVVIAGVGWGALSAISFVFATAVMLVPRLLGLRPSFDIAFGTTVVASTWSSVLGIYVTTRWWDLPMHFVTNGLCAALLYIVLVRTDVIADHRTLPRPTLSVTVVTTVIGVTLGVLWEFFEWYGHTFIDREILVGYADSLGDVLWGGLGSLLAGFGMTYFMTRPDADAPDRLTPTGAE